MKRRYNILNFSISDFLKLLLSCYFWVFLCMFHNFSNIHKFELFDVHSLLQRFKFCSFIFCEFIIELLKINRIWCWKLHNKKSFISEFTNSLNRITLILIEIFFEILSTLFFIKKFLNTPNTSIRPCQIIIIFFNVFQFVFYYARLFLDLLLKLNYIRTFSF
jgi:hypothetical protein